MSLVIIASPQDDSPTRVSSALGDYLTGQIMGMGHMVVHLPYPACQKPFVDLILSFTPDERMFIYTGHGFPKMLAGSLAFYDKKSGMIDKDNIEMLKGINNWTACWSARNLAMIAEDYAKAILAFDRPLYVFYDKPEHNFQADWIDIHSTFPLEIARGKTVKEGYAAMRDKMKKYIAMYDSRKNEKDTNYDYYFSRAISNYDGAILFGNKSAALG